MTRDRARQWNLTAAAALAVWATCMAPVRAEDQFFDSDGVKIRYTDQGPRDGEPVVLIHGFACNIEFQWGPVLPQLARDHRVIALDCRGHGHSDKPHDPDAYGLNMVDDVARLLEHLNIPRAHIVGYSMGAGLAARFAVKYPDMTLSVVMGGAGVMPDEGFISILDDLAVSLEKKSSMAPLILALTPPGAAPPSDFQVRTVDMMMMGMNDPLALAAMVREFEPMLDQDAKEPVEHWRAIEAPVLAIVGADDPLRQSIAETAETLPGLKVVVIPGRDHVTTVMAPEFVRSIDEFLDAVPAATP
ncbi:MAG: alpha/beta hydrolase [Planctomycetales bacterium]|nr:alpha/beta hydrolase [Planctomycetales bacterium]